MILRTEKSNRERFTVLDNRIVADLEAGVISAEGFAVLVYLLSKPDHWQVRVDQLAEALRFGRDKLRAVLLSLKEAGYADLVRVKDPQTGKFQGTEWVVFEERRGQHSIHKPKTPHVADFPPEPGKKKDESANTVQDKTSTERLKTRLSVEAASEADSGNHHHQESRKQALSTDSLKTRLSVDVAEKPMPSEEAALDVPLVNTEVNTEINTSNSNKGREGSAFAWEDQDSSHLGARKNHTWEKHPVEAWNAGHFLAYFLDRLEEKGKTALMPKAAGGRHMKVLLEKAVARFGEEEGRRALRLLIDACVGKPRCAGTGFLLNEAERFWTRWNTQPVQPPKEIRTLEDFWREG